MFRNGLLFQIEAQYKNYLFIRFWVYGRKDKPEDPETMPAWKPSFRIDQNKGFVMYKFYCLYAYLFNLEQVFFESSE